MKSTLIHSHSHYNQINPRKLRLSVTDQCNLHCFYCKRFEQGFPNATTNTTTKKSTHLSKDSLLKIVRNMIQYWGIEEIRITGGEPTTRDDLLEIVQELSMMKLKKLAITSNGQQLLPLLSKLKEYGLFFINISLDSLNPQTYNKIVGGKSDLGRVIETIILAKEMGFKIKINTVLLNGINVSEIAEFVEFSFQHQIEVRFLELIKIGAAKEIYKKYFYPIDEIKKIINAYPILYQEKRYDENSTASVVVLKNGAHIGFIASESTPFCDKCNRIRLDSRGILRLCLKDQQGIDLTQMSEHHYQTLHHQLLFKKSFYNKDLNSDSLMYEIGG